MAAIALVLANRVSVVESIMQHTAPCAAAVVAGQPIFLTAAGLWTPSNAATAPNAVVDAIAAETKAAGMGLTGIVLGVMDGWNFDGIAFRAPIYLGNTGGLDTAAGTVSKEVGRLIGGHAHLLGVTPDKLLLVNCLARV